MLIKVRWRREIREDVKAQCGNQIKIDNKVKLRLIIRLTLTLTVGQD